MPARSSSRLRACVLATVAVTLTLTAAIATEAATPNRPHAVGLGDSYVPAAGNPGYDVQHYGIAARYRPGSGLLTGRTAVTFRATSRLRTFNLDLLLAVDSVTVNGTRTPFRQTRHELTVRPAGAVRRGSRVVVRVRYHGRPAGIRYGGDRPFVATATGAIAVGEPGVAAWWFPSNDHPSDKARFDVSLTVPKGFEAVSNGALVSRRGAHRRAVWRWSVNSPMATYLAFAAFGRYDLTRGRSASGLRYLYAFERGLGHQSRPARMSVRRTPAIVDWLQAKWGAYPFRNLGGVVPNVRLGFALENQTRPVYGRDLFRYGVDRSVVVHELAHQWFGDKVSLSRWHNIWLNEGFATYSEWLWEQHRGGRSPARRLRSTYRAFEPSSAFWDLEIGNPGPARMFDDAVYDRGAMVVQALRHRLGSRTFFNVVRRWTHADRTGSIAGFRRLAGRISGQRLTGFFQHWLFSGTRPAATAENGLEGV
ncbi:MAG: M1 family metallopeptidase [Propionibacteriales bacterium]|nr:M1 family metallopeptidase [Propionibacteriales bacterium]